MARCGGRRSPSASGPPVAYAGLAVTAHRSAGLVEPPSTRRPGVPSGPRASTSRRPGWSGWRVVLAVPFRFGRHPADPQHRLRRRRHLPPQARRPRAAGRPPDRRPGPPLHPRRGLGHRRQAGAGDADDARARAAGLGLRGHQLPPQSEGHLAGPHRGLQTGDRLGAGPHRTSTAATRPSSPLRRLGGWAPVRPGRRHRR